MGVQAVAPKEPRHSRSVTEETSAAVFDAVDRQILDLLQSDGRIKLSELGRRVRLSPAAVTERVRRLEASGAVTGYGAHVSPFRRRTINVTLVRWNKGVGTVGRK